MKIRLIPIIILVISMITSCSKEQKSNTAIQKQEKVLFQKGNYAINKMDSKIIWTGKQLSTKQHEGTINILDGDIQIDKNGFIKGEIKIDMKTINTTNLEGQWKNKLDGHLKSPDFFDVNNYPSAYLKFRSDEKTISEGNLKFDGQLTIKGITHPISFTSKIKDADGKLTANAELTFDRSLYNVKYGSGKFFSNLGDKMILDDISVEVVVVASK